MQKHKMAESMTSERLPSTWRMSADTQSGWTAATQNIKRYQQRELNLMCKTDVKTRNYIISLLHNEMFHRSRENWICKNEFIIDFGGQNETKYNKICILSL